ncbi:MAG: hypothetical protein IJ879_08750 [Muribaculaceae bacterium]|nr:hypothetical protein [Muribaculaceae bacterium]
METAKISKDFSKYIDTVVDAIMEYRERNTTDLAEMSAVYVRMVQAARWLEVWITKQADQELQEVKPAITMAVTSAALDLAARATRHYYVEQDYNAAAAAGLEDE